MPHRTLQVVAALIFACAIGGFVLGYAGTPQKARLPGESSLVGAPLEADEAQPLSGVVEAPKPPEPVAKDEEKTEEAAEAADSASAKLAEIKPPKLVPPPVTPAPVAPDDKVGDLIDGVTPPPTEAPPY